ncbi:MAG: phosphodiester glycosidase family protein, partial [Clostridia bacterium]|nr:phosphodiester glycosidase family protein [Clostridia bacterium]
MKKTLTKLWAMTLAVVMMLSAFSINTFATNYNENATNDDYYKLISQKNWQLAPGIKEAEVVINNTAGTRRQVVHSVTVDMNNPYTNIIPGYKGMIPKAGSYGTQTVSQQALNAEKLGYGNVVAATNATLSWYTEAYYVNHPELIGEPLAYAILNGYHYQNSNGPTYGMSKNGSDAILVINYDNHPTTGEPRPDNIPKVLMRKLSDPLTGWEQNAIPAWQWLVKPDANGNPVNQYSKDHGTGIASRTFVGITAEGEVIISVSDGDQAPFSTGFTMYEMADYMIKMGCIYACNQDGGGSTTFCSQRPGEDLKVTCSLSDGGERPVTSTIMVISNAPADGELSNATISSDYDYYTPGSTVKFDAIGIDASGAKVDIPEDVSWTIKENGMGSISNGVFTSNGTEGTVTAQMIYKDNVVGEHVINIATPDAISLNQSVVTIPYGKTVRIPIKATVNNGLNEIGLGSDDISFTTDNPALGTFNGLNFNAVDETNAPANISSNVTATLNIGSKSTLNFTLKLGKGSDVLFDFEGGQSDVDIWNVIDNRKGTIWDYDMALSLADKTNGKVHDGNYSMRLELNGLSSKLSHSAEYGWIRLGIDGSAIELENARSLGFWMYIPDDCIQLWAQGNYMADTDGNGTYDTQCLVSMPPAFPNQVHESVDEPGWYYLEMDLSQYEKIALKDTMQFVKDPSTGAGGAKGDFFISFIFARAKNNPILDGKTVIGPYTFYLDNFTVDYSDAVDDREKPVFDKIYMNGAALGKREAPTTTSNTLTFTSNVADATVKVDANKVEHPLTTISGINASSAKATIDGVEIPVSYSGGVMTAKNVTVADGYHRIRFEITDNAGNTAVMIRVFKVESGKKAAKVQFVPADPTLDKILFGSVYWMNLKTTAIDTIQSVETVIDMNSVNHWQLDHMILAEGFTASYTIDEDSNTATITFTRNGFSDQTGTAILAKIPVRILDYDNDIHVPGKTAAQYWATH